MYAVRMHSGCVVMGTGYHGQGKTELWWVSEMNECFTAHNEEKFGII